MINQNNILCQDCDNTYSPLEAYCPNCGQLNPLFLPEEDVLPRRKRSWWRSPEGCLTLFLFCLFVFGCPVLGFYDGLKKRAESRRAELDRTYQQALVYKANNQTNLAINALEYILAINPSHIQARQLLTELKPSPSPQLVNQSPTPTTFQPSDDSTTDVESLSLDLAQLFEQAKSLSQQGRWAETASILDQIRGLDPTYQPRLVSDAIYNANAEQGLRLIEEGRYKEAMTALNKARTERPDDPLVVTEWEKVFLYVSVEDKLENGEDGLIREERGQLDEILTRLNRLYALDPNFGDVKTRLYRTYLQSAEGFMEQAQWCLAQARYEAAAELKTSPNLMAEIDSAREQCALTQRLTPTIQAPTSTPIPTVSGANLETGEAPLEDEAQVVPTQPSNEANSVEPARDSNKGKIYFARLNPANGLWEIFVLSPADGAERVLLNSGIQPAVNRDGTRLVYHSLQPDSLGLHAYNLGTGQDIRITIFAEDVLPKWGHDPWEFVFASQRSGDRQWRLYTAFADGKSEAIVLTEGQTPALSPDKSLVAYQGADPSGNNPGIYLLSKNGGSPRQLTASSGDRSPAFSPQQDHIAYMSVRSGTWDIWRVAVAGGEPTPLAVSPANEGHPVWSPDGSQVAFVSDRDGAWGVYVVEAQGGEARRLTSWGSRPDWLMGQLSWSR